MRKPPAAANRQARRTAGRAQQDNLLDPYQRVAKLPDGTVCRECGAVHRAGRWTWAARPADAREGLCPACRRIAEASPAGIVTIRGPVAQRHKTEIVGLARHQETAEKAEHPLNRIIEIAAEADAITVTTTDIHLPRRIGEALKRAFHGKLAMHFDDAAYFARVDWSA